MTTWGMMTAMVCAQIAFAVNEGTLPVKEPLLHEHPTLVAMLEQGNTWRSRHGLSDQRASPYLMELAQAHANWMATTGRFQHNHDHSFPEIIFWNAADIEGVFAGWMNSGPHRGILLSRSTHVGYGYAVSATGQTYWCGIFGNFREEEE